MQAVQMMQSTADTISRRFVKLLVLMCMVILLPFLFNKARGNLQAQNKKQQNFHLLSVMTYASSSFPVIRKYASLYFSMVRAMTSSGRL